MNKQARSLKLLGSIICVSALILLFFLFRKGSLGQFSFLFIIYVLIEGIGIYNHHPLALFGWKLLVTLLFPVTLIAYYGAFDGGPPYPFAEWLLYILVFGPLIAATSILWVLIRSYHQIARS